MCARFFLLFSWRNVKSSLVFDRAVSKECLHSCRVDIFGRRMNNRLRYFKIHTYPPCPIHLFRLLTCFFFFFGFYGIWPEPNQMNVFFSHNSHLKNRQCDLGAQWSAKWWRKLNIDVKQIWLYIITFPICPLFSFTSLSNINNYLCLERSTTSISPREDPTLLSPFDMEKWYTHMASIIYGPRHTYSSSIW